MKGDFWDNERTIFSSCLKLTSNGTQMIVHFFLKHYQCSHNESPAIARHTKLSELFWYTCVYITGKSTLFRTAKYKYSKYCGFIYMYCLCIYCRLWQIFVIPQICTKFQKWILFTNFNSDFGTYNKYKKLHI